MSQEAPKQLDLFQVTELPGRPMLHWNGKRPLREIPYYPAQRRERYGQGDSPGGWTNRLYWGDNLQVMAHLMREFRGQIKLIYIDPPFDSGADYRKRIKLHGTLVQSDMGVLEERQYTDIWSNDLYLQYMYERLILMRELLAEDGSLYLHCDYRRSHYLRLILEEVFGGANFRNEIVWKRTTSRAASTGYNHIHDTIFFITKSDHFVWNTQYTPYTDEYIDGAFRQIDADNRRYRETPLTAPGLRSGPSGQPWKGVDPSTIGSGRHWAIPGYMAPFLSQAAQSSPLDALDELDAMGRIVWAREGEGRPNFKQYLDDLPGVELQSIWTEFAALSSASSEATAYPTQKPEALLERIILASSNPNDLISDFFIGSGTTAAVAQKLGRRWIGADINLGAVHTTAQRLTAIAAGQQGTPRQMEMGVELTPIYPVFEVYNVNHYEVFKNAAEARDIVLQLYGVEPLTGSRFFDGVLDGRWVKVVDLNRICSRLDVQSVFDNLAPDDTRGVVVLCAGHEYDVPALVKRLNVQNVLFEMRDILTDRQDVIFKRPPEAQVRLSRADRQVTLTIEQFYSPLLLQKLSLEETPEAIEDWRQMVASVLIDPAYDGDVFNARIIDHPERQDKTVQGEYSWTEKEYGSGPVAVKIVDVLDEEWWGVVEVL